MKQVMFLLSLTTFSTEFQQLKMTDKLFLVFKKIFLRGAVFSCHCVPQCHVSFWNCFQIHGSLQVKYQYQLIIYIMHVFLVIIIIYQVISRAHENLFPVGLYCVFRIHVW